MRMDSISFESSIITDRSKECHRLYPNFSIVHLNALVLRRPCSCAESVKGEHSLIYPHQLHIPESGYFDCVIHFSEEVVVQLVGVVDDLLAAMDEFKLDPELFVCPLEK